MALSLATVGGKITAAFMNAIVALVNKQGLTSVIPTSVAGTGVTLGSGGVVTFTGSSTVSLNGCFNSTYDAYLVVYTSVKSANTDMQLRLRLSGSDISTSNYNNARHVWTTGSSFFQALATNTFIIDTSPGAVSGSARGSVIIQSPALAAPTGIETLSHSAVGNSALSGIVMSGHHSLSTAYDGMTLFPASGTITGTVRVYGYNNN